MSDVKFVFKGQFHFIAVTTDPAQLNLIYLQTHTEQREQTPQWSQDWWKKSGWMMRRYWWWVWWRDEQIDWCHSYSCSAGSTLRRYKSLATQRTSYLCEAQSIAPIIHPITRNLKLSQGSVPMKSQLCSHQHIKLPHKIHQSCSCCYLMLPGYLMLQVAFGLGLWFPTWGTWAQSGS